ncbi:MAG: NIPSNAP family protein [Aureliella sp.]
MLRMKLTLITAAIGCIVAHSASAPHASGEDAVKKQVMELRTYTLKDDAAVAAFDQYASEALIPALNRLGIEPVGAFELAAEQPAPPAGGAAVDSAAQSAPKVMLLLPAKDAQTLASANEKVAQDEAYQKAAEGYLQTPSDKPIISRISSEMLVAFDCWPQVKTPQQKVDGKPRLYELRTYESPTEHLGHLKVEMFNSGEVPIFLDCDIHPVFMGQAVVGPLMPNLTYMTVYDDADALAEGWKRFAAHPEWKKLREVKKYIGTVSKIHKSNWVAKPYSQL